ncbi:MAG: CHAD domain-containing protein, partial [Jatrophihabitantaceae bacterium]
ARRRGETDPDRDAALHRARKAAKRARYVAELSIPALGKPARKAAKRWRRAQNVLGSHQDGVIAAAFLRALIADDVDFTLGVLWAGERLR